MRYSYPKLSEHDYGFFRLGGPGLANCLFVAARAWIDANRNSKQYIEPTWRKFSIGPWLRRERDKRIYNCLFNAVGLTGLKKFYVIKLSKNVTVHDGLGNYFEDLNQNIPLVSDLISRMTVSNIIKDVPPESEIGQYVGIHIRLGDYIPKLRVPIDWYKGIITNISNLNKNQKFLIFSDGTDEELTDLLKNTNVKRVFYGNAFADMIGLSRCKLVIASDSTFSAWGAFIGHRPIIFSKRHFPKVYSDDTPEYVLGDSPDIPTVFNNVIQNHK